MTRISRANPMSLSRGYLALWRSVRLGCRRPPLQIVSLWSEKDCPFADRPLLLCDVFFLRSLLVCSPTRGRSVRAFFVENKRVESKGFRCEK